MRQSIPQSIILSSHTFKITDWPLLQSLEPNMSQLTSHVDSLHIHPELSIGIDSIRELSQFLQTKPLAHQKIVFIHQAQKLTLQAQNALLKILEEPPSFSYLFLITPNPMSLLETIRSRCVILSTQSSQEITTRYLCDIPKLNISHKIVFGDAFNKDIQTAKHFLEELVQECRQSMLHSPTSSSLFNCLLTLHGLKLLSVNTNPKLVVDYVLFRLKAI